MRGFRNCSDEAALLLVILQGDSAGRVDWDPGVIARARETGLVLDEAGDLVEITPGLSRDLRLRLGIAVGEIGPAALDNTAAGHRPCRRLIGGQLNVDARVRGLNDREFDRRRAL